jgi:hypothetical protein
MKVRIERQGGLAGRPASGERDEADLSPEQRAALEQLRAAPPAAAPPGADRFRYRVRLSDANGEQEFEVGEDAMPDALAGIARITP